MPFLHKPTRAEVLASAGRAVLDSIGPGLRVLFCRINAHRYSSRTIYRLASQPLLAEAARPQIHRPRAAPSVRAVLDRARTGIGAASPRRLWATSRPVPDLARIALHAPADALAFVVVEQLEGNANTDYGAPGTAPSNDVRSVDADEL